MNAWHDRPRARRRAAGLTLVELMVASVIIVMLILIVGRILAQIQQVVQISEGSIRNNARAMALRNILMDDVRRASQGGFLCITQALPVGSGQSASCCPPQMFVGATGTSASANGADTQTDAIYCIGQCPVAPIPADATKPSAAIIYHIPLLFNATTANALHNNGMFTRSWNITDMNGTTVPYAITCLINQTVTIGPTTYIQPSIQQFVTSTSPAISQGIPAVYAAACNVLVDELQDPVVGVLPSTDPRAPTRTYPPASVNDVGQMCDILATGAQDLSIMWTDGTTTNGTINGTLAWYGVDRVPYPNGTVGYQCRVVPKDGSYPANGPESLPGGRYRALFTRNDLGAWPTAVKIRFRLTSNVPTELSTGATTGQVYKDNNGTYYTDTGIFYEVICPVGQ